MNELGTGESSTVRFWFHHGQPPLAGSSVVPKPFEAFDHDSSVGPIQIVPLPRRRVLRRDESVDRRWGSAPVRGLH
jgi:hypothetical protein